MIIMSIVRGLLQEFHRQSTVGIMQDMEPLEFRGQLKIPVMYFLISLLMIWEKTKMENFRIQLVLASCKNMQKCSS